MKKLIALLLFICIATSVGISSVPPLKKIIKEKKEKSEYYYYLRQVFYLVTPDETVIYVIKQSLLEKVNPLDMVAILQIENPTHKANAINKNIKKVWDAKKKKTVSIVVSTDNGLFQLNSLHVAEFIERFWTPFETETFDINNYEHNTRVAIRLYKSHLEHFGDESSAVCAYNAGKGSVTRETIPKKTLEVYLPRYLKYKSTMTKMGEK